MRKPYATTLEEDIIKRLKIRAVEENRTANDIIEEALIKYLSNKNEEDKRGRERKT